MSLSKLISFCIFIIVLFLIHPSISNAETCPNNPSDNPCWVQKAPMPTARRDLGVASDLMGNIYAAGGYDGTGVITGFKNKLEKYNINTNSWEEKASAPVHRNAMGFTFHSPTGKFYYAGGYNEGYFSELFQYDPGSNTWTQKSPMIVPRAYFGLVTNSNGNIYAIGGQTNGGTAVGTVEEYDPSTNTWSTKSSLPTPRTGLGVISMPNGKIYAIGGHLDFTGENIEVPNVEVYDPSSDTWNTASSLPSSKSIFSLSINSSGNFYVMGGYSAGSIMNTVEEYNISNNTWTSKTNFPLPLMQAGAALGVNGKVYLLGGQTTTSAAVNSNYAGFIPSDNAINLNVPFFKQTDPLWGFQEYDSADKWSSNPTISAWGCALTSAAMVFRYHGINKLPDGTTLDPGTLNTWLKKQKDGYVGKGLVNWLALSRLSKQATSVNHITAFDALEFKKKITNDKEMVKTDLENQIPDILGEPGHFIVAKGIENDIITINDPAYSRSFLTQYSNTFNSINKFTPSNTDLSYIMLTVDPDTDIVIKDSNGNPVNDSLTFIEEPLTNPVNNSETNGNPLKIVYLEKPEGDDYEIVLNSPTDTNYNLGIYLYDIDGDVFTKTQEGSLQTNEDTIIPITFDPQINFYPKKISFGKMGSDMDKSYRDGQITDPDVFSNLENYFNQAFNYRKDKEEEQTLEYLMKFEKVLYNNKGISIFEDAFNILLYDVNYLETHL